MESGKHKNRWLTVMHETQMKKDVNFEGQMNILTLDISISA